MKKIFLLFALCSLILVSCDDDKEPGNNGKVQLLETVLWYGVLEVEFEYDSQHRISKMIFYDTDGVTINETITFVYDGNSILLTYTHALFPQYTRIYTRKDNKVTVNYVGNYVNSSGIIYLDNDSYPIKSVFFDGSEEIATIDYKYLNGNLIQRTETQKDINFDTYSRTFLFAHDNKKSPFYYCRTPKWVLIPYFLSDITFLGGVIGIKNNVNQLGSRPIMLTYDGDFLKTMNYGYGETTFTYIVK